MRYFVSGDYHLGHSKCNDHDGFPFKDAETRNRAIITHHNQRVKPEDIFIHDGDFCFKSGLGCQKADYWINQLNGNKIFIKGNHDNNNSLKTAIDCLYMSFANYRIKIVHKPEHADPTVPINLIAHVHTKWKIRTFAEHYQNIYQAINGVLPCDRKDWERFIDTQAKHSNSQSILLNVGVSVQGYMPITLDEAIKQIHKHKKGVK